MIYLIFIINVIKYKYINIEKSIRKNIKYKLINYLIKTFLDAEQSLL